MRDFLVFVPPPKPTNLEKTERKKIVGGLFSDYRVGHLITAFM